MKGSVSRPMLERLPLYAAYLEQLQKDGVNFVSATGIANGLSLGEVQVRKELSFVSGAGRPRIGYRTDKLLFDIRNFLGENEPIEAVIIGAGKLGLALLEYGDFREVGVHIGAAFDKDISKSLKANKSIFAMDKFDAYCKNRDVKLGIITVPASAAQSVCDLMLKTGIKAIWNFAPTEISVPNGISVINEKLAISLSQLRHEICQ